MNYICTKKLSLGGTDYRPGDTIPSNVFVNDRARKLKASGYIAEAPGEAPTEPPAAVEQTDRETVEAVFVALDNEAEGPQRIYPIVSEQLQAAVNIMQKNAEDAGEAIEDEVDETVLTFVAKVDSRKTVKAAAEKQLGIVLSLRDGSEPPATGSERTETTVPPATDGEEADKESAPPPAGGEGTGEESGQ